MFTIGQFSRICRVPPKTLRYYDEIGLLKQAQINTSNQYRYYFVKQIFLVREIALYKEMGLSLEAIKNLISEYETEKGEQFLKLLASQKERIEGEILIIGLMKKPNKHLLIIFIQRLNFFRFFKFC